MRSLPLFGPCFVVPYPEIRFLETDSPRRRGPRRSVRIAPDLIFDAARIPYRPPRSKYGVPAADLARSRDAGPPVEGGLWPSAPSVLPNRSLRSTVTWLRVT